MGCADAGNDREDGVEVGKRSQDEESGDDERLVQMGCLR